MVLPIRGPLFLWKSALISGANIQHADDFAVSGESIVLAGEKRPNVRKSDILSDIRRRNSPLSRLGAYLGKALIAMTGAGHYRGCSMGMV